MRIVTSRLALSLEGYRNMTRCGIICLVICLLFPVTHAIAAASALSPADIVKIDAVVRNAMRTEHLSGVEIGIGRNGRVLFAKGYGLRDRQHHLPATATTVFPVGSITKSFTATAVMTLVQQGKIALDSPIARYLSSVPHGAEVTVRELLDQTSGLPDYLLNKPLYRSILTSTVLPRSIAQYVQLIRGKPLLFKPGSKWAYSNTNYAILGMLIEKVSGEPYARFMNEHIFDPFGLARTQVMRSTPPLGNDVADGYNYDKTGYVAVPPQSMSWANSAGAIASDAADLISFDGRFFAGEIVSLSSVRTMLTPPRNRPMVVSHDVRNNLAGGYGFAWVSGRDEGRKLEWHNGGLIGGRAMNVVWPKDGLEIVVLTNMTVAMPESIALKIARILYAP
jgi:D-alanyl-D-alanine carboxypeptidase